MIYNVLSGTLSLYTITTAVANSIVSSTTPGAKPVNVISRVSSFLVYCVYVYKPQCALDVQAKSSQQFEELTKQLKQHRLYRQHELTYGTKDAPKLVDVPTPVDDCSPITTPLSPDSPGH